MIRMKMYLVHLSFSWRRTSTHIQIHHKNQQKEDTCSKDFYLDAYDESQFSSSVLYIEKKLSNHVDEQEPINKTLHNHVEKHEPTEAETTKDLHRKKLLHG